MTPIYLDYMATTPVDERVANKMQDYLTKDGVFGNPASVTHAYGVAAKVAVDTARDQVANAIGAQSNEIIFTSGATEANNLALIGAARFHQRKGKHILTCQTEHKAVLDPCKALEREGFTVTYLKPKPDGLLDLEQVKAAIQDDTILISIMLVNNEIGVIQDIAAISEMAKAQGALLFVDGAQALGKIPVDVRKLGVDLMSFSAHKVYGPKGCGALYINHKPRVRIEPIIHGGGHEQGVRSGTLATHQIVGMGEAFAIACTELLADQQRIRAMQQQLLAGLKAIEGTQMNGSLDRRVANNINVSFAGIDGEALITALKDIAISSGSACSSATIEPSHVLRAIGLPDALAHSSIRISLGRFTTVEQINDTIRLISEQVQRLRQLAP